MENINQFESSLTYGFIQKNFTKFNDSELFQGNIVLFSILKKIKLWYGTPAKGDDNLNTKAILGIECQYKFLDNKVKKGERHIGSIVSNDVVVKELELSGDDFFTKFYICFDDIITYLKLISYKGKTIELGDYDPKFVRHLTFNEASNPHAIQTFYGFYDKFGLRAIGFKHVTKIKLMLMNYISILRLRHLIKHDSTKNDYWSNENNTKKLNDEMKAVAKLVYLPDIPFISIFKFMIG